MCFRSTRRRHRSRFSYTENIWQFSSLFYLILFAIVFYFILFLFVDCSYLFVFIHWPCLPCCTSLCQTAISTLSCRPFILIKYSIHYIFNETSFGKKKTKNQSCKSNELFDCRYSFHLLICLQVNLFLVTPTLLSFIAFTAIRNCDSRCSLWNTERFSRRLLRLWLADDLVAVVVR